MSAVVDLHEKRSALPEKLVELHKREKNQHPNIQIHFRTMKGTDHFKTCIKTYLDKRAQEDELFRVKYGSIDDVVTDILNEVKASGCCGFSDDEIYGMAVHVIAEPNIEIGKPINSNVLVNHYVELTEEEKAEQKARALKRFQDAELQKLQTRNSKPKAVKPQENNNPNHHSLISKSMKPRTKFDKLVVTANDRLTSISPKAIDWAVKHLFKHPAFRVSSGLTTGGDCGQS